MARAGYKSNRAPNAAPRKRSSRRERPYAISIPEFDLLIHERMRLGIVSALSANDGLSFTYLRRLLKTTDGNLSVHARKLEEAGYLSCSKFFEGRLPKTEYKLTPSGRQAFDRYLRDMESVIRAVRGKE
ncbi:MAG TPA: transcriptional regulator [Terriglobales bacterium]|nr:transcriptional regulator [Terriglobales bacterium]